MLGNHCVHGLDVHTGMSSIVLLIMILRCYTNVIAAVQYL